MNLSGPVRIESTRTPVICYGIWTRLDSAQPTDTAMRGQERSGLVSCIVPICQPIDRRVVQG
jgi:hypothetical protein